MTLIVLDRDGVINIDREDYVTRAAEWESIPGSLEGIARLTHAGYRVAIASNQAGLAKKRLDFDDMAAIHAKMQRLAGNVGGKIDALFFCPHASEDNCDCRKPQPGLLLDIARRYQIKPNGIIFIGDSLGDVEAARKAGSSPVLVLTGHGAQTLQSYAEQLSHVPIYKNLGAFVEAFLDSAGRQ